MKESKKNYFQDMRINSIPQLEPIEDIQVFQENNERIETKKHSMNDILKYQHILMKIFGLSYFKDQNIFITIYSFICIFIHLINAIKSTWNYKFIYGQEFYINSSNSLDIVTQLVFNFSLAMNIFMFYIQRLDKKIERLNWQLDQELNNNITNKNMIKSFKRKSFYIFILIIIYVSSNTMISIYALFGNYTLYSAFKRILAPFSYETWVKDDYFYRILNIILIFPTSGTIFVPLSYYCHYCIICSNLYTNMDRIIFKINKKIKFAPNQIVNNDDWESVVNNPVCNEVLIDENGFDKLYDCFSRLSSITTLLNFTFNKYTFLVLICLMPCACLLLYVIADWKNECQDSLNVFLVNAWIVISFFNILTMSFFSANINFHVILNKLEIKLFK